MARDSRRRIVAAAIEVFSRRGFHGASMDEIARVAGVAKGTLYYNFPDKPGLFAVAVSGGIEGIIDDVRAGLDSDLPFPDHLRALLARSVELYLGYSDLARILFRELSSGIDADALAAVQRARARYLDFLTEVVEDGQRRGYLREGDPRLTAVSVAALLDGLCGHHLDHPGETTAEAVGGQLYGVLTRGIVAPK